MIIHSLLEARTAILVLMVYHFIKVKGHFSYNYKQEGWEKFLIFYILLSALVDGYKMPQEDVGEREKILNHPLYFLMAPYN